MIADNATFFILAIIYIAILFVFVRPASKGPAIIQNLANAMSDLVRGVTGETFDSSTGKWKAALWVSKDYTTRSRQLTC